MRVCMYCRWFFSHCSQIKWDHNLYLNMYSCTVQNAQNFNEYLKYLAISLGTSGVPTLEMNTLSFQLKIITSNNRNTNIKTVINISLLLQSMHISIHIIHCFLNSLYKMLSQSKIAIYWELMCVVHETWHMYIVYNTHYTHTRTHTNGGIATWQTAYIIIKHPKKFLNTIQIAMFTESQNQKLSTHTLFSVWMCVSNVIAFSWHCNFKFTNVLKKNFEHIELHL